MRTQILSTRSLPRFCRRPRGSTVVIPQVDSSAAYNRLAKPVGADEGVTRETFDIAVWSVIRLCLHSTLALRKAASAGA